MCEKADNSSNSIFRPLEYIQSKLAPRNPRTLERRKLDDIKQFTPYIRTYVPTLSTRLHVNTWDPPALILINILDRALTLQMTKEFHASN